MGGDQPRGSKSKHAMVAELTTDSKGDAAKGKEAADANGCTGCHQMTAAMLQAGLDHHSKTSEDILLGVSS
jgi:cytochrome c551/c552